MPRKPKMHQTAAALFLRSRGEPPRDDQEFLEQALRFANDKSTERDHFAPWQTTDSQIPYLEEWRKRKGTTERARMPSFGTLAEERRVELRSELGGYLKDRAASRRRFIRALAASLSEIVIKPTWRLSDEDSMIARSDEYWIFSWPEMLAYLLLLLHDEHSEIPPLCQCKREGCGLFFLAKRTRGRPQTKYHDRNCMLLANDRRPE